MTLEGSREKPGAVLRAERNGWTDIRTPRDHLGVWLGIPPDGNGNVLAEIHRPVSQEERREIAARILSAAISAVLASEQKVTGNPFARLAELAVSQTDALISELEK